MRQNQENRPASRLMIPTKNPDQTHGSGILTGIRASDGLRSDPSACTLRLLRPALHSAAVELPRVRGMCRCGGAGSIHDALVRLPRDPSPLPPDDRQDCPARRHGSAPRGRGAAARAAWPITVAKGLQDGRSPPGLTSGLSDPSLSVPRPTPPRARGSSEGVVGEGQGG
jgi:hypothetical protein